MKETPLSLNDRKAFCLRSHSRRKKNSIYASFANLGRFRRAIAKGVMLYLAWHWFVRSGLTITYQEGASMARYSTRAVKHLTRTAPPPQLRAAITPRQCEILRLVSLGHTNREIAGLLRISTRTVEVHRFNLMCRLNVRNVAQLLRKAWQQNLLPRTFGVKRMHGPRRS